METNYQHVTKYDILIGDDMDIKEFDPGYTFLFFGPPWGRPPPLPPFTRFRPQEERQPLLHPQFRRREEGRPLLHLRLPQFRRQEEGLPLLHFHFHPRSARRRDNPSSTFVSILMLIGHCTQSRQQVQQ